MAFSHSLISLSFFRSPVTAGGLIFSLVKTMKPKEVTFRKKISALLGWNRTSYFLLSGFIAVIMLIIIVWWPLAEEYLASYNPDVSFWLQMDWLLLGIFFAMSLLIMGGANWKQDLWIVLIGLCGGLVIESWGTQTQIWVYYTQERPPLWIIPAWPIASLSIDRLVRLLAVFLPEGKPWVWKALYWLIFIIFGALMVVFVMPTIEKPMTLAALLITLLLSLLNNQHRLTVLTFSAGAGLGYFLELWGTTRACWTYYTLETPPLFAVLAHGLAAVAFWRSGLVLKRLLSYLKVRFIPGHRSASIGENHG